LPANPQTAAHAKGRARYDAFIHTLGRWLANGQSLVDEVLIDTSDETAARQHETVTQSDRDALRAK
jgi:hypothetical protein